MKKGMLVCLAAVLCLVAGSLVWAADFNCPPDEKEVQTYCQKNHADKVKECVKEIMGCDCGKYQELVEKGQAEKSYGSRVRDCMKGGGGVFGCGFWMIW